MLGSVSDRARWCYTCSSNGPAWLWLDHCHLVYRQTALQEKAATTPKSLPCLRDNVTMLQVAGCRLQVAGCRPHLTSTIYFRRYLVSRTERIVILGFRGQLGRALMERLAGRQILALDFPEVDMTQPAIVEQIADFRPEVVINAAAWTNVDGAEDTPDACYAVNVTGVQHLALACQRSGAALVQVSTNEVFPGEAARFLPRMGCDGRPQRRLCPQQRGG